MYRRKRTYDDLFIRVIDRLVRVLVSRHHHEGYVGHGDLYNASRSLVGGGESSEELRSMGPSYEERHSIHGFCMYMFIYV